jgi:hypothetical protein
MKTTEYLVATRKRSDRSSIADEWILFVRENPTFTVVQSEGRIRKWAMIPEIGKYWRVILLEDGETVHNAFFDRSFERKKRACCVNQIFSCRYKIVSFLKRFCGGTVHEKRRFLPFVQQAQK